MYVHSLLLHECNAVGISLRIQIIIFVFKYKRQNCWICSGILFKKASQIENKWEISNKLSILWRSCSNLIHFNFWIWFSKGKEILDSNNNDLQLWISMEEFTNERKSFSSKSFKLPNKNDGERGNFVTVRGEFAGPCGRLRMGELSREQGRGCF